ncbi:MAG: TonB-dependent receptor [Spirochaetes bacterium]|nr:TonB-dependent receptor [Spirochaetota bacterium]
MKNLFKICMIFTAVFLFFSFQSLSAQNAEEEKKEEKNEETASIKAKGSEANLGKVVVNATKIGKKQSQVTDTVTVISEEQIEESALTDTTDLLRYTPGVQFKRAGGPGQYVYTKLRGYGDGNFAVLIDGMKINESMSSGTGNFLSKLDPSQLERIEVLHGPQSSLYGADTTAGVMSYTTKGATPGLNVNTSAEYGTYNWKKVTAGIRGTEDSFRYAIHTAGTDSDGIHEHEDYRNLSSHIKLGWGKKYFDAEVSYLNIISKWNYAKLMEPYYEVDSSDDLWAFQIPDPERYNKENYNIFTFNQKYQISDEVRQKLMLGWYKKKTTSRNPDNGLLGYINAPTDNFTVDYVNYYNEGETVPIYDDDDGRGSYYENENKQVDYNLIWDKQASVFKNTVLFGLNWTGQSGKKWGKYGENEGTQETRGIYINDQLLLVDEALVIDAGIRYDDNTEFKNKATWKFGSSYTLRVTETTFFGNYGTSFKQPTITHIYDPKYGNEGLKPEEGWMVQGGARQQLLGGNLHLEATAWKSELKNVIAFKYLTTIPTTTGIYVNRDRQETQGVESAFQLYFFQDFLFFGNYTYTKSETESDGVTYRTVQISRHAGSLGLEYNWNDKLFLGVYGYYQGPRLRWKGDVELEEWYRCDVNIRYKILGWLNAYARFNNILNDKHFEDPYESPGFNFVAGLSCDLNFDKG